MEEKLKSIEKEAVEQLRSAEDLRVLDSIRVKYMGKKGVLTEILRPSHLAAQSAGPWLYFQEQSFLSACSDLR